MQRYTFYRKVHFFFKIIGAKANLFNKLYVILQPNWDK